MIHRRALVVFGLALASLILFSDVHASEIDRATKLTFSQSVQIPGQVLPAGTYWFVATSRKVVQVFNQDRSKHYATLLTIPAEHLEPSVETEIIFADRGSLQPGAIVTWFYPGETRGREFLYSKQDQKEISRAKLQTVMAGD
jgi:hypothetical protein